MTDPELGQPAERAEPVEVSSSCSKPIENTKTNKIFIGFGCLIAAIVVGVVVGVPDLKARKNARLTNSIKRKNSNHENTNTLSERTRKAQENTSITLEETSYTSQGMNNITMNLFPVSPSVAGSNPLPFRFGENLQPLSKNVMAGYSSCGDLIQDVEYALESLANEIIELGRDMECWWDPSGPYVYDYAAVNSTYYMCAMMDAAPSASFSKEAAASPSSTEDSFGTNNQVEGVDEADIIKSNGKYVFMGYGKEVIVLDLMGNVVDRVEVPLPPPSDTQTLFVEEDQNASSTSNARKGLWPCGPPQPQYRRVVSLLMYEDEATGEIILNVVTTFDDWTCTSSLCGGLTTAFIYKFSGSTLKLVASQDINGTYNNARSISSINHIITNAGINTWTFTGPLYRCDQAYWNMTYEEYEQAAFAKANEAIASYAKDIVNGLSWASDDTSGNACQHVVQISSMTTGDEDLSLEDKRSLRLFWGQGVLQNFVQITSIDLESVTSATNSNELGTVDAKAAGAFLASYSPELYATGEDLILAGRGWRYDSSGQWDEYTFLMSFDLSNGAMAVPRAVGEVTGYLQNQFSIDMYQDSLRVATTSFQKWKMVQDEKTGNVSWEWTANSTSQVTILQDNGNGELTHVGLIENLGPAEDIQSVRFIRDRGYVVTFRTVDPLYSLDLSNPIEPKVMGELKISGFSAYMHPISGGNGTQVGDFLLTVGSEANETDGRISGTKISVFDVRDITKPSEVANYVIDNNGGWSGSDAAYDHYAFRYLEESKKLIIPLYVYDWLNEDNNFDGFVVYDIDIPNQEISVTGNVTHSEGQDTFGWCWGAASLPSRSMVFKGDLMTFKSHSIKMTKDVNNLLGEVWPEVNLDANRTKEDHCYGYWPWLPFY